MAPPRPRRSDRSSRRHETVPTRIIVVIVMLMLRMHKLTCRRSASPDISGAPMLWSDSEADGERLSTRRSP